MASSASIHAKDRGSSLGPQALQSTPTDSDSGKAPELKSREGIGVSVANRGIKKRTLSASPTAAAPLVIRSVPFVSQAYNV